MKKLKAWWVYMDDGKDAFKCIVPAESQKAAEKYVQGNGEVIAVREETERWIDTHKLANTLRNAGWGDAETMMIVRTLEDVTEFARQR